MVACSQLPEVAVLIKFLRRMGGSAECTMIGHAWLTSVVNAAMANGGMAHAGMKPTRVTPPCSGGVPF